MADLRGSAVLHHVSEDDQNELMLQLKNSMYGEHTMICSQKFDTLMRTLILCAVELCKYINNLFKNYHMYDN